MVLCRKTVIQNLRFRARGREGGFTSFKTISRVNRFVLQEEEFWSQARRMNCCLNNRSVFWERGNKGEVREKIHYRVGQLTNDDGGKGSRFGPW